MGATAGLGFPRPLALEAMVTLGGYVGLGAEYGLLPTIQIDGVAASSWSLAGDLRVFPFRNAFFVGVLGGYQHVSASGSVTVASVTSPVEAAALDGWFVNPRAGFLWRFSGGFTVGIDAGVELPVASSFSSTLPSAAALAVQTSSVTRTLSGVLPTVDLVRLGFTF